MAKTAGRNFTVDMWWTDLHDVEIGFFIHSRHRAKSREFTQDADMIGEVLEGGERTGLISYREGLWKSEHPGEKRLVLKLFTPSMNWRASMEMLGRAQRAAFGGRGRLPGDRLFHPSRRARPGDSARALGAEMARHAGAILVFPDGGWRGAALPAQAGLDQSRRRLHAVRSDRRQDRASERPSVRYWRALGCDHRGQPAEASGAPCCSLSARC